MWLSSTYLYHPFNVAQVPGGFKFISQMYFKWMIQGETGLFLNFRPEFSSTPAILRQLTANYQYVNIACSCSTSLSNASKDIDFA